MDYGWKEGSGDRDLVGATTRVERRGLGGARRGRLLLWRPTELIRGRRDSVGKSIGVTGRQKMAGGEEPRAIVEEMAEPVSGVWVAAAALLCQSRWEHTNKEMGDEGEVTETLTILLVRFIRDLRGEFKR